MKKFTFVIIIMIVMNVWQLATIDKDLQAIYQIRYINKTFFLKVPITNESTKVYVTNKGYRFAKGAFERVLFKVGEQIRVDTINFKGKEIKFKIISMDIKRKAEIKFIFPKSLDNRFSMKGTFNLVLKKFFTTGLKYSQIENAKIEYISDQYNNFIQEQANLAQMKDLEIHEAVIKANPIAKKLSNDIKNLKLTIKKQKTRINELKDEKNKLSLLITKLKQEQQILHSASKEYRLKIKLLTSKLDETNRKVKKLEKEKVSLNKSIAGAWRESGISSSDNLKPKQMLAELSNQCLKLKAANQAYKARLITLNSQFNRITNKLKDTQAMLNRISKEKNGLQKKLSILTSKDKTLARKMFQLEHEKNIIESKLLSKQLLKINIGRKRLENQQIFTIHLLFKNKDLGSITLSAPLKNIPNKPLKLTMENNIKPLKYVVKKSDKDASFLLKHLKRFPNFIVQIEKRNNFFKVTNIQSPEKDNTSLWVWNIRAASGHDVDLVVQFSSRIEKEVFPLFDLPINIPYPSVQRTLEKFLQPLPLFAGLALGLLISLPFFIIQRKRLGSHSKRNNKEHVTSLHIDHKEL